MPATESDVAALTVLLGREPRGAFEIVVRDAAGAPMVIRNAPLLDDGTPMPTRFWLVDPELVTRVSRIESTGGVRAAEAAVDADELRRRARAVRGRARRRAARRPRGPASARRRRRHAARREVPARALRVPPRRRRRPGRSVGRRPRSTRGRRRVTRVAAVDIGTNSTRLLVADVDGRADAPLDDDRPPDADHAARPGCERDAPARSRRDRAHGRGARASTRRRSTSHGVTRVRADGDQRVA